MTDLHSLRNLLALLDAGNNGYGGFEVADLVHQTGFDCVFGIKHLSGQYAFDGFIHRTVRFNDILEVNSQRGQYLIDHGLCFSVDSVAVSFILICTLRGINLDDFDALLLVERTIIDELYHHADGSDAAHLIERNDAIAERSGVHTGAGAHATVMYLVFESFGVAGAIAAADKPKPSAAEGVAALQALGCEVYLLTGDARGPAIHVAAEVGIDGDHVLSEVLPDQKANAVSALLDPSQRKLVAMVGDGINDTPALATADVSIAMGAGSDAALEVGQIVLMHDDVRDVARAIQLSRATMRKIHQNFGWALGYNLILVPLAAFGILPPELSSACMALSSVSVVTNSLLLRFPEATRGA